MAFVPLARRAGRGQTIFLGPSETELLGSYVKLQEITELSRNYLLVRLLTLI
jgi:hypothetical protein